jgi:asparaginyl-tRNA synthetase
MDVLAPEGYGEIVGGGQREDDLETLEARHRRAPPPPRGLRLGTSICADTGRFPHAGFGLGVERTVGWVIGLHHVRETIPFARMMERITP